MKRSKGSAQRAGKASRAGKPAHSAASAGLRARSFGKLRCDGALRILSADAGAGRLLGRADADFAQSGLLDLLHCGDRRRAARGIATVASGEASSYEDELRILRQNGHAAWTFWTFRLTRGRAVPSRISAQVEAIGEKAAFLSDRADKMLRQAIDGAAIGMRITTPTGRALIVNHAMSEILGYDAEEIALLRDEDVAHPDDCGAIQGAYRQLLAGEIARYRGEARYMRKDGTFVWVRLQITRLDDETTGKCIAVSIEAENIDAGKQRSLELTRTEELIRSATTYSPIGFALAVADGTILKANAAFAQMVGYERADLKSMNLISFVHRTDRPDLAVDIKRLLAGEIDSFRRQRAFRRKAGDIVWVLLMVCAVGGADGSSRKLLCQIVDVNLAQDMTAHIKQLEELHEAKELAQVTIASVAEGLIRTDIEGLITLCNDAAAHLLGCRSFEMQGKYFADLVGFVDHRNGRALPDPVTAVLAQGKPVKLGPHAGLKRRDGRVRPIIDSTAPLRGLDGRMIGAVVVIQDATETFVLTERLAAQAYRDDLTRLPNRRAFEDHIAERLRAKCPPKLWDFLLFVDLDHFKVVNDTCGHATGDELLQETARILQSQVRESDFVARLGGDEFGIVLHATSERVASAIAERLLAALGKYRFVRGGRGFEIGASIGMTTVEACNGGASAVMIEADTACYAAKNLGRGRFHVFRRDDATIADARRSMGWLQRIQEVFEKGGFRLFVQKIIDVSGETRGYEALMRLVEEDGTLCSPEAFLPVAKRFGLMARIDRLIFQQVFDLLGRGAVLGEAIGSKYVSVNMSAASLADPMFRAWLNGSLLRNPQLARSLWIEITETDEMRWAPAEVEFLANIRGMGVRLYLDDFGTGYNSFDILKRIDVDGIKIDRKVVRDIACDPIDQALVVAAISIVADLGIELVAEGVEDTTTLDFLVHHGIKRFQGYLFHRPEEAAADFETADSAIYRPAKPKYAVAGTHKARVYN
jgi:diguanylate cyclase